MRITTEDRSDLKGPAFYFVYADKVKSGNDDVDLHQEAIITNNHNFINSVVEITMYYWGQTRGNCRKEPCYSEVLR